MLQNKATISPDNVKKVFETEWFTIEAVSYASSKQNPYYRLSGKDAVAIFALTPEHKIVLIKQFRPAVGSFLLEVPSGSIENGESFETAIRREMLEETGYACDSVNYVGAYKADPCRFNNVIHLFVGNDAKAVGTRRKTEEIEEIVLVSEEEFKNLISNDEFNVVPTIGLYSIAKLKGFF